MTVDVPPPRATRFSTPLVLSRVHWVRPELVAEVTYLTWTADGLLRHVVYEGLREDKSPRDVRLHWVRDRLKHGGAVLQNGLYATLVTTSTAGSGVSIKLISLFYVFFCILGYQRQILTHQFLRQTLTVQNTVSRTRIESTIDG